MSDDARELAFEELLRSPLDDEPGASGGWVPLAAGIVVGLLIVVAAAWATGGWDETASPTPTSAAPGSTAPATSVSAVDPDAPYPPGFSEVTDGVALAPLGGVQVGESLFTSVGTAVARTVEEPGVRFSGGRWELETLGGVRIPATSVVYDELVPTAFSLRFDVSSETAVAALHLVERWELDLRELSLDTPLTSFPFVLDEPVSFDLGDGVTFRVEALELDVSGGELVWSVDGVDQLGSTASVGVAVLDENGEGIDDVGYGARTSFGGGVFLGDATFLTGVPTGDTTQLIRAASEPPHGVTVRVFGSIPLIRVFPAELTLELGDVPIQGR